MAGSKLPGNLHYKSAQNTKESKSKETILQRRFKAYHRIALGTIEIHQGYTHSNCPLSPYDSGLLDVPEKYRNMPSLFALSKNK